MVAENNQSYGRNFLQDLPMTFCVLLSCYLSLSDSVRLGSICEIFKVLCCEGKIKRDLNYITMWLRCKNGKKIIFEYC